MAASLLFSSAINPRCLSSHTSTKVSFRHFNKRLIGQFSTNTSQTHKTPQNAQTFLKFPLSSTRTKTHLLKCSLSSTSSYVPDKNLFDPLTATSSQLTPLGYCKWSLILITAFFAAKWAVNLLLSPFFWMYFSWTWLYWPWYFAISIGVYGIYCFKKYLSGEATALEQFALPFSAFTWLTLVPPACANGFLEGWPVVFFLVYNFFVFLNATVRQRLYGDLLPREHDPKWDCSLPNRYSSLFCVAVAVAHWLAAFEGPQLHLIPGGWNNLGIWLLIIASVFLQYHSITYMAKYSEKVVVPTTVVQFGPYRLVRHPMYASTMLLFATYFVALRAPLSALLVVAVCLVYYEQKAQLEEALMVESFGAKYKKYMKNVRYKFIPFIY